jgi:soluble lytic murein transglycosylase
MLGFLLAAVLAPIGISACSSTGKNRHSSKSDFPLPPATVNLDLTSDLDLERALNKDSSEGMRYWVRYRQASLWSKLNPAKACSVWLELGATPSTREPRFPLQAIARMRALETCPKDLPVEQDEALMTFFSAHLNSSPEGWLRELASRASLRRAILREDRTQELRFSMEVATFEVLQDEQIRLVERARALAREIGDSASEEAATRQLERTTPRSIASPLPEQFFAVATDFRKAREFAKAREYYQLVVDAKNEIISDFDRLRALDGIRMTFKLELKTEQFIQGTREYSNFARQKLFINHTGKYVETRIALARALWTVGSPSEAEQILGKLESEVGGKYSLDESMFIRARIAEEGGHLDKAIQILGRLIEHHTSSKPISDRSLKRKIAWYHAWILRKSGALKEASERLSQLVLEEDETPSIAARNHFWLGRTFKDLGDSDAANTQFSWLIANDPLGYYGILAHRELGRLLPTISPTYELKTRSTTDILSAHERATFEWLVAVNETDLGRRFLDQLANGRRSGFTTEQTLEYLQLYARAGSYQALFARLSDLSPEIRQQILDKRPDLLFPRPWQSTVNRTAEKFDVKPELIFSIMRQESSFNPTARSSADALGLMQLIPEVARTAADGTDIAFHGVEDLYLPETNIALGSSHLRQLLNRWDGAFIPLVASYNASERAVQGWLRSRAYHDPLQFIEDIPYEETKGYVKLVMRNFVFYSRFKSTTNAINAIPFPEWCLNGLQNFKP